jgi:hypothetical protein
VSLFLIFIDEINGRITTNNFHDVGDMCHDLQTIGDSYFPKNKSPKVVYGERERENVTM